MAIDGIQGIKPINIQAIPINETLTINNQEQDQFKNILTESIKSLNAEQIDANQLMQAFLNGEGPALHTVMLSGQKANLSMEFAVQVRNKVMEAYQEVMRMQV